MSTYDQIFDRFEQKSPFAVLLRTILQRLLPAEKLDKLFSALWLTIIDTLPLLC